MTETTDQAQTQPPEDPQAMIDAIINQHRHHINEHAGHVWASNHHTQLARQHFGEAAKLEGRFPFLETLGQPQQPPAAPPTPQPDPPQAPDGEAPGEAEEPEQVISQMLHPQEQ